MQKIEVLALLEIPITTCGAIVLYSLTPVWLITLYDTLVEHAEPLLLALEGWGIVLLVLFISRVFHAQMGSREAWAKTWILVIAACSYVPALVTFGYLFGHANVSSSWKLVLAVFAVVLFAVLAFTLRVEAGIISDAGMLSLFLVYALWMAIEQADDRPGAGAYGIMTSMQRMMQALLVDPSAVLRAFAPLISLEFGLSVAVATIAVLALAMKRQRDQTRLLDGSALRLILAGRSAGLLRTVFLVVYTHFLSMHYGYFEARRSRWRLFEIGVALFVYAIELLHESAASS